MAMNLAIPLHLLRVADSRSLGVSSLSLQSQAGEPRSVMRLTPTYLDSAHLTSPTQAVRKAWAGVSTPVLSSLDGLPCGAAHEGLQRNLPYVHPQSR